MRIYSITFDTSLKQQHTAMTLLNETAEKLQGKYMRLRHKQEKLNKMKAELLALEERTAAERIEVEKELDKIVFQIQQQNLS